ncbi:hypothetical protein [Streptomyces sp. NPDC056227]|uniref:hypothetical protein n=1 Tax=Streptomyces sp. NPDC056227 TaxID=3345753 RepID=UPI0035DBD931
MTDPIAARQQLVDDRHYKYRGCAPDPDQPTVSAADPDVPLDAWGPYTGDGAEPQKARFDREKAAKAICGRCSVLALCRTYANTTVVDADGVEHLAEPEGVMGGELALTRHRALIARRHAATTSSTAPAAAPAAPRNLSDARTPQKMAVLRALTVELYDERVARRAGMDVRTSNWHRSALCSLLGLNKETATRDELLVAAVRQGLLSPATRIVWDGFWPIAAAPTTDGSRQRRIAPDVPAALLAPRPRTRRRRRPSNTAPAGRRPRTARTPRPATALPLTPSTVLEPAA